MVIPTEALRTNRATLSWNLHMASIRLRRTRPKRRGPNQGVGILSLNPSMEQNISHGLTFQKSCLQLGVPFSGKSVGQTLRESRTGACKHRDLVLGACVLRRLQASGLA